MDKSRNKQELMIIALQQRIGEMVANYEGQIAALRADITQLVEANDILKDDEANK